jgi:hypothetical protein
VRRISPGRRTGFRGIGGGASYNYLTQLGSLVAAWDFALGVTPVSGGVDSILDQSGRGNTLTAPAATNRPTYNVSDADFNGQPCGVGDGTDDGIRKASISMGAAFAPGTTIVVGKIVSTVAGRTWLSVGTTSTMVRENTASLMECIQGTGVRVSSTTFSARAHVIGLVSDGSNVQLYVDGAAQGAPAAYSGTTADGSSVGLFSRSDSPAITPASCKIAFTAITLTALSAQQMADFATYARARWGTP